MKLSFQTYGNDKQKLALQYLNDNITTEIGYGGGAGGGKSYTGAFWVWSMCQRYPGITGFFGRKELKRLKQTTLATYYKFLGDYNIPKSQRGIFNAQDSVIKFENGSQILLLDLAHQPSDPLYTRFGSLELTLGFIDESAEIDEQAIMILSTRVGRQLNEEYNIPPKILEGFNPDKGHIYRRFYLPHKDGKLPDSRVFIPALATDNKKLPKSYIEQLKKADEVTKQRLLYGNFDYDDTPGRIFDYNSILSLWDNIKQNGVKYISIDVARKGKDTTVIGVWDGLELVEIIVEDTSNLSDLITRVNRLALKYKVEKRHIIVDENGVGGGLVDGLRCQGFINNARPIEPKNSNLSNKRNFEHLKTQCYFRLGDYVNQGQISISSGGEEFKRKLVEELDVVVEIDLDKDSKTRLIKKEDVIAKLGRSPDYADMLMMRMFYELNDHKFEEEIEITIDDGDPLGIFKEEREELERGEDELELNPY